jgi:hypothetical protein
MVNWRDYEGMAGYGGSVGADDINALNKALTAGHEINAPGTFTAGDGFALRVESLERTLKNTTFRMEHIRLYKAIPKIAAYNSVEEYNQITSYGNRSLGGWVNEGELPSETDSTYTRQYAKVKYLGTTRRVSHVMSLVKPAHGNVIAQETISGTMYLLEQIERGLFTADSSLSRAGIDSFQWDGFEKLITDGDTAGTHTIDMRGAPLTEDAVLDAALTVSDAPAFGRPTHLHLNPKVHSDLGKSFFPKARYDVFSKTDDGVAGITLGGVTTQAGVVRLEPNVFIDNSEALPGAAVGDGAKIPLTPAVAVAPANAALVGAEVSYWNTGAGKHDAGDYFWHIVAVNAYGQSAPRAMNVGALTVTAGTKVTMQVQPAVSSPAVDYYKVFRTERGGATGTAVLIARIANDVGAPHTGPKTFEDFNENLPNTSKGYMFQQDQTNMSLAQLAPLIKIPLATVDSSIRWMMLYYGVPKLYTPLHNVILKNIGRATDFVGAP